MAEIVFADLGRGRWNGRVIVKDNAPSGEIAEIAYRESLKHLLSRFPDTQYDADTNEGIVTVGSRVVGHFKVEEGR